MKFLIAALLMLFVSGNGIVIKDQWVRPGAEKMSTALYFTIENEGDETDTLYSIDSDASNMIQMHETYSKDDLMGMREIGQIVINPGEKVTLEPGGMHIMVMKLKKDLKIKDKVAFNLHFRKAGDIKITAEVKE
ncbi:copper chaperone PCu(A)C [bacterium BMS3Abin03]|nr:copper chaperone PCu(A)C [bacterium BMS3Abin03]MCG6958498.1 copper chaperone PCu(A)C [bacterium BMS3Abin03]